MNTKNQYNQIAGYRLVDTGDKNKEYNKKDTDTLLERYKPFLDDTLGKDHPPFHDYNQIKGVIGYNNFKENEMYIVSPNCHVGQRKLLLNEIQFYSCYTKNRKNSLIVYAGSADGHHVPVIMRLFPDLKFLLIDPNYHDIQGEKINYVYQNPDTVSKTTRTRFRKLSTRSEKKNSNGLMDVGFYNTDKSYDVLFDDSDKTQKEMIRIMKEFNSRNHKSLLTSIKENKDRVYIIQDYMTGSLSDYIAESNKTAKMDIYFVTDIRTNMFSDSPHDLDIIWNYALQVIYLKKLNPVYSMLKFRPYYMGDKNSDQVKNYHDNPDEVTKMMKVDIEYAKREYGIDIFKDYMNSKLHYFPSVAIWLQPWAPKNSSESRLIISREGVNSKFVNYDPGDWDSKFYYMTSYRSVGYHGFFHKKLIRHKITRYDGCFDCMLETLILLNYINGGGELDEKKYKQLRDSIDDPDTRKRLIGIHSMIHRISNTTYYTSDKCLLPHTRLRSAINRIRIYVVDATSSDDKYKKQYLSFIYENGKYTLESSNLRIKK